MKQFLPRVSQTPTTGQVLPKKIFSIVPIQCDLHVFAMIQYLQMSLFCETNICLGYQDYYTENINTAKN